MKKKAKTHLGFPQLCNGIVGVLGTQGCRFDPQPVNWVKDLALSKVWLGSQLKVRSDPWPRNSVCCGAIKKEKKKTHLEVVHFCSFQAEAVLERKISEKTEKSREKSGFFGAAWSPQRREPDVDTSEKRSLVPRWSLSEQVLTSLSTS